MPTPICSAFLAASLDGYIARPDGALDWLAPFEREEHGYARFFDAIDALVIGRNTYDVVLGFDAWPYGDKRCVVLTHRATPSRHGEELVAETPRAVVDRLGRDGVRRIYVDGGVVVHQFLAAGLLEDLTLSVIPIVLGDGIPLFGKGAEHRLTLQATHAYPSGLVQLSYRCAAHGPDM